MFKLIRTILFSRVALRPGLIALVFACGHFAAGTALAQQESAGGKEEIPPQTIGAVVSCVVCHGPKGEGKPALGAPRIGGMSEWYLDRQLEYFRESVRGASEEDVYGTQMRAVSLTLENLAEVDAMAQYFSTLEPPQAPDSISGDVERGKQLYSVCAACHGTEGKGNEALNSPAIAGQHDWYIVRQLENYQKGLRGDNPRDTYGVQMAPIVKTLDGRKDFIDLAAYISTL